jgi:cytochrome P450
MTLSTAAGAPPQRQETIVNAHPNPADVKEALAAIDDPEAVLALLRTPEGVFNPYPYYNRLREIAPVYRGPGTGGLWFLTSWEDCNAMMRSKTFGNGPDAPVITHSPFYAKSKGLQRFADFIMFKDPPDHTRLRSYAVQVFTSRIGDKIQPYIDEVIEGILNDLDGRKEFEFVADFAFKLPGTVISEMLGVPREDHAMVDRWIRTQAQGLGPHLREEIIGEVDESTLLLQDYLLRLSRERRKNLGDDMMSQLITAKADGVGMDERELIAMLNVLLSAGTETTQNLLGGALYALLKFPDQMKRVQESDAFDRTSVDEFMRYDGPALISNVRFAFAPAEFSGQKIAPGEPSIAILAAANHDPAKFDDPEGLDVGRKPNLHLGFAAGIHVCLGAPLARPEVAAAIPRLVRRFPKLSLIEPPSYKVGAGAFRAQTEMRVAIG